MIEAQLRALILPSCAKVYPTVASATAKPPFIVYTRISTPRLRDLDGPSGMAMPLFQVDVYAASFNAAQAMANDVRIALDGHIDADILDCRLENQRDGSDLATSPDLFRVSMDFRVTHRE